MPKLLAITGCMFSGKTNEFVKRVNCERARGRNVGIFKPNVDTRSSKILSRDGSSLEAEILYTNSLPHLFYEKFLPYEVIAIDEVQFFPDTFLPEAIDELIDIKDFILSGLSRDFIGRPFGAMSKVLTMADEIIQEYAICNMCKRGGATRTRRLSSDNSQILVGLNMYEANCAECYFKT